jgi:signal transduction histidine kinase
MWRHVGRSWSGGSCALLLAGVPPGNADREIVPLLAVLAGVAALAAAVAAVYAVRSTRRLRATYESERDAARRAERTITDRNELQRIFMHDLGNALHAIELRVAVMTTVDDIARVRAQCETIRQVLESIGQLVGKLRDSTRAGPIVASPQPVDDLLRETLALCQAQARAKTVELRTDVEPDGIVVHADRDRLVQALRNLVETAIGLAPKDSAVAVSVRQGRDVVEFLVHHGGAGIAREQLPHVFERRQGMTSGLGHGTGLGLLISKSIVESHGGRIWAESDGPSAGATLCFSLPRSSGDSEPLRAGPADARADGPTKAALP